MKLRQALGILKSRIIYDFNPVIHRKLRLFYSQFVKDGDLCFDLGAHTGNRSAAWLDLKARVIALEPQPVFADIIRKKLGQDTNLRILQKAVSNESGKAILKISYSNPAVSTISESWTSVISEAEPGITWDEALETDVTTLDELIREYGIPDFCKIDVEGQEEAVLKGCNVSLPALSFEFFPTILDRAIACIHLLERRRHYQYNWSFGEKLRLVSNRWMRAAEIERVLLDYHGKMSGDIYAVLQL